MPFVRYVVYILGTASEITFVRFNFDGLKVR